MSHIDNDHILGLLDLFEDIKTNKKYKNGQVIHVGSLWHNSFSDIMDEKRNNSLLMRKLFLSKQFSAITLKRNKMHIPVIDALKGVGEGRDLRKLAQSLRIHINSQFGGDLIVARDKD